MIPKFIFGEDVSGEREFIIHAHEPIIIYERVEEGEIAKQIFEKYRNRGSKNG